METPPATPSLDILAESPAWMVIAKPAGVLVQAPPGIDCIEDRVRRHLHARDGRPLTAHLGIVHRLDRPATGALLLGLRRRTTRALSTQFAERTVEKTYVVLVEGDLADEEGTWRDHVRKIPDVARAEVVPVDHPEGRPAVLHYRVLGADAGLTALEVRLETGRTHQIRVQAASRGLPVAGDGEYGASGSFGPPCDDPRGRAIALHARALAFDDPTDGRRVTVTAALPPWWPPVALPARDA